MEQLSRMRLEIDPVIMKATDIELFVGKELSAHEGIRKVAGGVKACAIEAKRVALELRRPIGLHRLPAAFLIGVLTTLAFWLYWEYFHISSVRFAISARDAVEMRNVADHRLRLEQTVTSGSAESLAKLESGEVDIAFVQGGVPFDQTLPHTQLSSNELLLFFLHESVSRPQDIRSLLTSNEGQGSHLIAKKVIQAWGIQDQVEFDHEWRNFESESTYRFPDNVDSILVVKDPSSPNFESHVKRLAKSGFRLSDCSIGVAGLRETYLMPVSIPAGYLVPLEQIPTQEINTYWVKTYMVAKRELPPNKVAQILDILRPKENLEIGSETTVVDVSEVAQGLDAALSIFVYTGISFLALAGVDVYVYRRRFHELNSLVSLISMHQSSKDVLHGDVPAKLHAVTYLSACSDLLTIISAITGYYTQENSALMYNRLSDVIHERCDSLKINIQLKILHATIDFEAVEITGDQSLAVAPKLS